MIRNCNDSNPAYYVPPPALPFSALDPLSLEFVEAFQTMLQQALDLGREGQVHMVAAIDRGRDSRYQYNVGDWAFLASSETPVPGENHFQCKWTVCFLLWQLLHLL